MNLVSKLYKMADESALVRVYEWKKLEDLAHIACYARNPEDLLRAGEDAVKEGVARGWPALIDAGRLLKEEAKKWGEKRMEARQKREEADRAASRFSLGGALRAAL